MARRSTSLGVAGSAAFVLFCLSTAACASTEYVIPPAQASQMDDADWVIKREPKPQEAVAPADSIAPQAPEPAPAPPNANEAKP